MQFPSSSQINHESLETSTFVHLDHQNHPQAPSFSFKEPQSQIPHHMLQIQDQLPSKTNPTQNNSQPGNAESSPKKKVSKRPKFEKVNIKNQKNSLLKPSEPQNPAFGKQQHLESSIKNPNFNRSNGSGSFERTDVVAVNDIGQWEGLSELGRSQFGQFYPFYALGSATEEDSQSSFQPLSNQQGLSNERGKARDKPSKFSSLDKSHEEIGNSRKLEMRTMSDDHEYDYQNDGLRQRNRKNEKNSGNQLGKKEFFQAKPQIIQQQKVQQEIEMINLIKLKLIPELKKELKEELMEEVKQEVREEVKEEYEKKINDLKEVNKILLQKNKHKILHHKSFLTKISDSDTSRFSRSFQFIPSQRFQSTQIYQQLGEISKNADCHIILERLGSLGQYGTLKHYGTLEHHLGFEQQIALDHHIVLEEHIGLEDHVVLEEHVGLEGHVVLEEHVGLEDHVRLEQIQELSRYAEQSEHSEQAEVGEQPFLGATQSANESNELDQTKQFIHRTNESPPETNLVDTVLVNRRSFHLDSHKLDSSSSTMLEDSKLLFGSDQPCKTSSKMSSSRKEISQKRKGKTIKEIQFQQQIQNKISRLKPKRQKNFVGDPDCGCMSTIKSFYSK